MGIQHVLDILRFAKSVHADQINITFPYLFNMKKT